MKKLFFLALCAIGGAAAAWALPGLATTMAIMAMLVLPIAFFAVGVRLWVAPAAPLPRAAWPGLYGLAFVVGGAIVRVILSYG